MASVSITNQTLTMTITIDGVDTVIRKDNCKVQAFGDVVRITDYKGSIYEFLYSDCTSPSEANANDLRDAIEEFLNTGEGGGGGGITTLTSTDGSIDIDLTDPDAPDLSIPSGSFAPTISNITNDATVDEVTGFYSRSGVVVTGMFECTVSLDAGDSSTSFEFNLPITTNFANRNQLQCTCNVVSNLVNLLGEAVISESKGSVLITAANNGDQLQELTICYQYLIV